MSNADFNSVFLIETEKIKPNPYQPRRDFDEDRIMDLAESIKQYGILQPLIVSRIEITKAEGGLVTEYELISGERRLRAAKIANVFCVPAIIRTGDTSLMKLELAIIENVQREDLNAIDRALAFSKLRDEFKFTHDEIAKKIGKSREYVSNSMRILSLPKEILNSFSEGKISEGHARPLLMLVDHPEEQIVLFKEILYKKITVREAEKLAQRVAIDKTRKKDFIKNPEIIEIEEKLQQQLGARVRIDDKEKGGQIKIDYFSIDDLRDILNFIKTPNIYEKIDNDIKKSISIEKSIEEQLINKTVAESETTEEKEKETKDDSSIYNIAEFNV